MFGFLKDKLKAAVSKVTRKVEEEAKEEELLEEIEIKPTKREKENKEKEKQKKEIKEEIRKIQEDIKKENLEEEIQKKGFFSKVKEKVTTTKISESQFDEIFEELQITLLENNVALEVVDKIKEDLKMDLVNSPLKRGHIESQVRKALRSSIEEILTTPKLDIIKLISKAKSEKRPFIILIIGYNGSGKSITCAKLGLNLKNKGFKPILAAGDTFRAAGASQLVEYGKSVGIPVVHNEKTQDSCSVIFEAVKNAKSKLYDVVIADTSGRIHNNKDLIDELKKISRVNNPDVTLLVLDSLTGSDVVYQMDEFDKAIGVDGVILTKADVDEKGGAFLSAVYIGKKPVLYVGYGQRMDDLKEYNPEDILKNLGLDEKD